MSGIGIRPSTSRKTFHRIQKVSAIGASTIRPRRKYLSTKRKARFMPRGSRSLAGQANEEQPRRRGGRRGGPRSEEGFVLRFVSLRGLEAPEDEILFSPRSSACSLRVSAVLLEAF